MAHRRRYPGPDQHVRTRLTQEPRCSDGCPSPPRPHRIARCKPPHYLPPAAAGRRYSVTGSCGSSRCPAVGVRSAAMRPSRVHSANSTNSISVSTLRAAVTTAVPGRRAAHDNQPLRAAVTSCPTVVRSCALTASSSSAVSVWCSHSSSSPDQSTSEPRPPRPSRTSITRRRRITTLRTAVLSSDGEAVTISIPAAIHRAAPALPALVRGAPDDTVLTRRPCATATSAGSPGPAR